MANKINKGALIGLIILLGVVTAYCGLLIPGLMLGGLAFHLCTFCDVKLFSMEEESDEEEES